MPSLPASLTTLDPRRSLRARFAWLLGVSGIAFAFVAASLVEQAQRSAIEASVGQALRREAHLVGQALATTLQDRLALVRQTAAHPVLSTGLMEAGDVRLLLEQVRANQPELAWIAVLDTDGVVKVATQALLEGEKLADERWFPAGLKGPWMGNRHPAGRLRGPFGLTHGSGTPEFMDMATPLIDYQGRTIGVLVAEVDWAWVEALHHSLVTDPDRDAGIDSLVLGPSGQVDIGPPALRGQALTLPAGGELRSGDAPRVLPWPDGRRYLSVAVATPVAGSGRELTLVARQDERVAFAAVEHLRLRLLQGGLLATLVIVAISVGLAGRVARPIRALSATANRLRQGEVVSFAQPVRGGGDELRDLAAALNELDQNLRQQISERAQAARQYQAIFEGAPDAQGMFFDGRLELANSACLRLFGAESLAQLAGRSVLSLVHPDDHARLMQRMQQLKGSVARLPTVEERIVRLDGHVVDVESSVLAFRDGARRGVMVVLRDISERKRTGQALAQSEERFRLALRGTAAGLLDWDIPANTVVFTDTWEQLLGRPLSELPMRLRDWSPLIHEGDRERIFSLLRALGRGERDLVDSEMRLRHQDGHWVALLIRAFLVRDAGGRPVRAIGTVLDVTERLEAREALSRLNAELEQRVAARTAELQAANVELDSFAHAVSHDLRAPLRAMSGFSVALKEDYADRLQGPGLNYLEHIVQSSKRMAELIDGLLTLSRNSRTAMHDGRVHLSALARRVVEELRQAEPDRVVTVDIADELYARGDARLLDVVLRNLIGNAWKYTGRAASPHITVDRVEQDGRRWFRVSDNGAGFDMKYAKLLFQAFQRLHRQDEFPGIGIGLATVQRIVQRHGGEIVAEGRVGEGASFRFSLPD